MGREAEETRQHCRGNIGVIARQDRTGQTSSQLKTHVSQADVM